MDIYGGTYRIRRIDMEIKQLIVDVKPDNCIVCPLMHLRSCGKQMVDKGNGYVRYGKVKDDRCFIKESDK